MAETASRRSERGVGGRIGVVPHPWV